MKKTRLRLVLDYPFFGSLALGLKLIEDPSYRTVGVTSTHIIFNPDFVATLTPDQRLWVFLHELCHLILGHSFRRDERDFQLFNMACDYAVNIMLKDSIPLEMPTDCLLDEKYKDWSSERIYDDLYNKYDMVKVTMIVGGFGDKSTDSDSSSSGGDNNSSADSEAECSESDGAAQVAGNDESSADNNNSSTSRVSGADGSGNNSNKSSGIRSADRDKQKEFEEKVKIVASHGLVEDAEEDASEKDAQSKVLLSKMTTRGIGFEPDSPIDRAIDKITSVDVSWKDILSKFLDQSCTSYYDWMTPNHRYSFGNVIMPTLKSRDSMSIAVAIDTSGSINDYLLTKFMNEFKSLIASIEFTNLVICSCDTRVHNIQTYQHNEYIDYKPVGGGGTRFAPVWDAIAELETQPSCLIYFTDLCVRQWDFGEDPGYPVLFIGEIEDDWMRYLGYDKGLPFGEMIKMDC